MKAKANEILKKMKKCLIQNLGIEKYCRTVVRQIEKFCRTKRKLANFVRQSCSFCEDWAHTPTNCTSAQLVWVWALCYINFRRSIMNLLRIGWNWSDYVHLGYDVFTLHIGTLITKTRLFKYIENFTIQKLKIFR